MIPPLRNGEGEYTFPLPHRRKAEGNAKDRSTVGFHDGSDGACHGGSGY
jgi:hypothetical protein